MTRRLPRPAWIFRTGTWRRSSTGELISWDAGPTFPVRRRTVRTEEHLRWARSVPEDREIDTASNRPSSTAPSGRRNARLPRPLLAAIDDAPWTATRIFDARARLRASDQFCLALRLEPLVDVRPRRQSDSTGADQYADQFVQPATPDRRCASNPRRRASAWSGRRSVQLSARGHPDRQLEHRLRGCGFCSSMSE